MGIESGSPSTPNQIPQNTQPGVADESQVLTNNPDTNTVQPGPGGSSAVVQHDQLIPPGPSQGGISGNERGSSATVAGTANSDEPLLDPANYEGSLAFSGLMEELIAESGLLNDQIETTEDSDEGPLIFREGTEGEESSEPTFARPGFSALRSGNGPEEGAPLSGAEGAEGTEATEGTTGTGQAEGTGSSGETAPLNAEDMTAEEIFANAEGFAAENMQTLSTSTDQAEIHEALVAFSGLAGNQAVTPEDKSAIEAALNVLAGQIAEANQSGGGIPGFNSWDPAVITQSLQEFVEGASLGLDTDQQAAFTNSVLPYVGASIAALNAASGRPAPVPELFTTLTQSTDITEIQNALAETIDLSGFDQTTIDTVIMPELEIIATKIADANLSGGIQGMESVSPETILEKLSELATFENNPAISPDNKTALRGLLQSSAESIARTNEAKWTQDTYSTNASVVERALTKLTNVEYDPSLTGPERQMVMDYLKIMSMALAFMSQIRAKIATMDAAFQKAEATGKLAQIKDQTSVAERTYENTMREIKKALEKMEKAKEKALIMKIVMPIVSAIIIAVTVVIMVAIIAASWGTASPAAIAIGVAIIAFAIGLGATSVALTSSGALDKMMDTMGVKNPVLRAAISMAIEIILVVIMIVATLGVGAAAGAVMFASRATSTSVRIALQALVSALKEIAKAAIKKSSEKLLNAMASQFLIQTGASIAQAPLSSGLVTQVMVKVFKEMGMSEKDAQMAAMIITLIMTLIMALGFAAAGGGMGGAGKGAGAAAKGGTAASSTARGAEGIGRTAQTAVKSSTGAVMRMLKNLQNRASSMLDDTFYAVKNPVTTAKHTALNPMNYATLIAFLAQTAQTGTDMGLTAEQIEITRGQMEITETVAEGNALLQHLSALTEGFDVNLDSLAKDGQELMQFVAGLMNLFAQLVDSASQITTELHSNG